MNQIIAEILIACIIISLLVLCIPLGRHALALMEESAQEALLQKEEGVSFVPSEHATGADVISVVRFYRDFPQIPVTLVTPHGSKTYTETTTEEDPPPYPIGLADLFSVDITYLDRQIESIVFTRMED